MGTFGELNRIFCDKKGLYKWELIDFITSKFEKVYVHLF